ncbi:MAG: CopG family transcriptional regulator [Spirochaetaceae bacterium]
MRMVTINVDDNTYDAFKQEAEKRAVSASSLIREAMEEYRERRIGSSRSIFDHEPASVGKVIRELGPDDDLLGEMLR